MYTCGYSYEGLYYSASLSMCMYIINLQGCEQVGKALNLPPTAILGDTSSSVALQCLLHV